MKKLLNKAAAVAASAVLSVMSLGALPGHCEADDTANVITVTFDFDTEGVMTEDAEALAPITVDAGSPITVPEGELERDGYVFRGWTIDGIIGFIAGDIYTTADKDVIFTPVWSVYDDTVRHVVQYYVEIDGEEQDVSDIGTQKLVAGQMTKVSLRAFDRGDAVSIGWTDGTNEFRGQERYIMADHDVTFTPIWRMRRNLRYYAGDVDRIVGKTEVILERIETLPIDLADGSTFKRSGFKLVGWTTEGSDEVFAFFQKCIMPESDITYTAVWEPIEVTVIFRMGSGTSAEKIKMTGLTDSTITIPEPTVQKDGYEFAGWKYNDTLYQPGDQFVIPTGVTMDAVYVEKTVTDTTNEQKTVFGDANEDGEVNMSDAVAIMRSQADPDEFPLTAQGRKNADVFGGDGVTNEDALTIQKYEAGIVTELPVYTET